MKFGRKEESKDYEEEFVSRKKVTRKPRNQPPKPWGKKERYLVFYIIVSTLIFSGILAASARSWKLPGLPRLQIHKPALFSSQKIIIEKEKTLDDDFSQKSQKTINEFNNATKSLSGVYGLYVHDFKNDSSFGINEHEEFEAASLIKLPIITAAFKENVDKSLIEAMGKKSDNTAQRKTVKILGEERIITEIQNLKMANTSYQENTTTPYDIGDFFRKLWEGKILSNDKKEEMFNFLTDTIYENHLAAGIPKETRVIHKYGREVHVVNDAGIIATPSPFVVVIMSKGIVESEADIVFPNLAKIVYNNMI